MREKICCLYKIYSKSFNDRVYVGCTVYYQRRVKEHLLDLRNNEHRSRKLQEHYLQYGEDDLIFEIIETFNGATQEERDEKERLLIEAINPFFNTCKFKNNHKGVKRSEDFIENARLRAKEPGFSLQTEESIKKAGEARRGRIPWNKGLTKETSDIIKKMGEDHSVVMKGKKHSPEAIEHMRESQQKRWDEAPEEERERARQAMIGNKWAEGQKWSDERREKQSKTITESWEQRKEEK